MEDLLKPELGEEEGGRALYSSRALFFTAFFGGPLAIMWLSAMNSKLLHRLQKDLWLYLCFLILMAVFYLLVIPDGFAAFEELARYRRENPLFKFGPRAMALVFWAISYLLHRRYHQAMKIMALEPLKPWKGAIFAILLGGTLQLGVLVAVLYGKGVL